VHPQSRETGTGLIDTLGRAGHGAASGRRAGDGGGRRAAQGLGTLGSGGLAAGVAIGFLRSALVSIAAQAHTRRASEWCGALGS
jgi:hypothetical protein